MWLIGWLRSLGRRKEKIPPQMHREGGGNDLSSDSLLRDELTAKHAENLYRLALASSGAIPEQKLDSLVACTFGRPRRDTFHQFRGDLELTLEEKRKLGLNTRGKYWLRFIEHFGDQSFTRLDPKTLVEHSLQSSWDAAFRDGQIREARRLECKYVEVQSLGECKCFPMTRFPIDEVPEFPHEGCPSSRCMCFIFPVLPLLEDWNKSK